MENTNTLQRKTRILKGKYRDAHRCHNILKQICILNGVPYTADLFLSRGRQFKYCIFAAIYKCKKLIKGYQVTERNPDGSIPFKRLGPIFFMNHSNAMHALKQVDVCLFNIRTNPELQRICSSVDLVICENFMNDKAKTFI